jgi:hypothetical protein
VVTEKPEGSGDGPDPLARLHDVEIRVVQLITEIAEVRRERDEMARLGAIRERELEELTETVRRLGRIRESTRSEVDGLLDVLVALENRNLAR